MPDKICQIWHFKWDSHDFFTKPIHAEEDRGLNDIMMMAAHLTPGINISWPVLPDKSIRQTFMWLIWEPGMIYEPKVYVCSVYLLFFGFCWPFFSGFDCRLKKHAYKVHKLYKFNRKQTQRFTRKYLRTSTVIASSNNHDTLLKQTIYLLGKICEV